MWSRSYINDELSSSEVDLESESETFKEKLKFTEKSLGKSSESEKSEVELMLDEYIKDDSEIDDYDHLYQKRISINEDNNYMYNNEMNLGLNNEISGYNFDLISKRRFQQEQESISRFSNSSLSSIHTPDPLYGKLSLEKGGQVGLRNIGNTCYLNSTLQCLTAVDELSFKLAEQVDEGIISKDDGLFLYTLGDLFREIWRGEGKITSLKRVLEPRQFKNALGQVDFRFSGYKQEDSQEALSIILDRLHEDLKNKTKKMYLNNAIDSSVFSNDGWINYCEKENSLVRELFHGQLKSSLKCCRCSHTSETFDPFCFLNLPIPIEIMNEKLNNNYNNNMNMNINVYGFEKDKLLWSESSVEEGEMYIDLHNRDHEENETNNNYQSSSIIKSNVSESSFNIFCFNDRICNTNLKESAYLLIRRSFKNSQEFSRMFLGFSFWVVELRGTEVISVRHRLPSKLELNRSKSDNNFIAFRADLRSKNYLVSLVGERNEEIVGFPILFRTDLHENLTPTSFIVKFFEEMIRPILKSRFEERVGFLDEAVELMLGSAGEYFKIERVGYDYDLERIRVVILDDKSGLNELLFFKEIDDPNDLFEELIIDLCANENNNTDINTNDNTNDNTNVNVNTNNNVYNDSYNKSYNDSYNVSYNKSYNKSYNDSSNKFYNESYNNSNEIDSIAPKSIQLKKCFDRLLSIENLNSTDNWKCEKCKIPVAAEKQLKLWRLPNILILHLKRFSFNEVVYEQYSSSLYRSRSSAFNKNVYSSFPQTTSAKIGKAVDFPIDLDLKEMLGEGSPEVESEYELFAVSQHFGSLNFGHYTAIIFHRGRGKWQLADDGNVKEFEKLEDWFDEEAKEAAYVLFYRRKIK